MGLTNNNFNDRQRVVILYSEAKREYFPTEEQYLSEEEVMERAESLLPYFDQLGYGVNVLPGNGDLPAKLAANRPALVLNLVDSIGGHEYKAPIIPALLELLNIPYLGTGMEGLLINMDKNVTKKILAEKGVPVPKCQLFSSAQDRLSNKLKFPVISKLNKIHGSIAINQQAISENERELRKRLKYLFLAYHQEVIVEEFIDGEELTAYVIDDGEKYICLAKKEFPPSEDKYKINGADLNWGDGPTFTYRKTGAHKKLKKLVALAFAALSMSDYAKFEIRVDKKGKYFFIDCNANPIFGPEVSEMDILSLNGLALDEVIKRLTEKKIAKEKNL